MALPLSPLSPGVYTPHGSTNAIPVVKDVTGEVSLATIMAKASSVKCPLPESALVGYFAAECTAPTDLKQSLAFRVRSTNQQLPSPKAENPYSVTLYRFVPLPSSGSGWGSGIATDSTFGSGYDFKGLQLTSGGNLADRGCIKSNWAQEQTPLNDKVIDWVLHYEQTSSGPVCHIYICIDGFPMGEAFRLNMNAKPDGLSSLSPCLTFNEHSAGCRAACLVYGPVSSGSLPAPDYTGRPLEVHRECLVLGGWQALLSDFHPPLPFKVQVTKDSLRVHVANQMNFGANVNPNGSMTVNASGMSTLMMPIGPAADVEREVKARIPTAAKWTASETEMAMYDASGKQLLKATRMGAPAPAENNPFVTN